MNDPFRGEWTSASNAWADRLCRGRHQAQIGLPELPSTEERETGMVIHALWTGHDPARAPTVEETEQAETLLEQEQKLAEEFFGTVQGLVRLMERRLWHEFAAVRTDPDQGKLKTSGQFDVVLVNPESRRALILDGKSGWLPITPNPSNLQLRRLAVLLWLQLHSHKIGVGILKPFAKPEPLCVYSLPDLERSLLELEEDVRQSHAPNATRTPGEEQCRYCRARQACPARLAWLSVALPVTWPTLPMVSARYWTPAQRVLFLEREKEARDWLEVRKAEIRAMLEESPEAVPGYGLRPGRTLETLVNPQEVFQRFCGVFGGTLNAFLKCIKVGKTALKEELRTLSGHRGRALESDLDALLSGCVERSTSAPTIEKTSATP